MATYVVGGECFTPIQGKPEAIASSKELLIPSEKEGKTNVSDFSYNPFKSSCFSFPKNFRNNILSLPIDDKGYLVRTSSVGSELWFGYPEGEKFPEYPLHYTLQAMQNMKTWMSFKAPLKIVTLLRNRTEIEKGFSIIKKTPLEAGLKETGKIK